MNPHLCIGTAQFGFAYGVTNAGGKVPQSEVTNLLSEAHNNGIVFLDTAQAYGESETVIGQCLPPSHSFEIITKLYSQDRNEFSPADFNLWDEKFYQSLSRLGLSKINAFLIHDSRDLNKAGSNFLKDWLISLKARNLVDRLGLSIYSSDELVGIPRQFLDLVQLPLSIYDQRMLNNGTIKRLNGMGAAVHARSIYLQGLLLLDHNRLPSWVGSDFANHHKKLEQYASSKGCYLIDLALDFVKNMTCLEAVVVGLCDLKQLAQLCRSWSLELSSFDYDYSIWNYSDFKILDPRLWPTSHN